MAYFEEWWAENEGRYLGVSSRATIKEALGAAWSAAGGELANPAPAPAPAPEPEPEPEPEPDEDEDEDDDTDNNEDDD